MSAARSPAPRCQPLRLTNVLPGWPPTGASGHVLGVLPGEGIGPEVVGATLAVLDAVAEATGERFDVRVGGDIGTPARTRGGRDLSDEVVAFCRAVFADGGAVLAGPGGGRFVYDLRARFDLYCKLTPITPFSALEDTGVLRPTATRHVDIVVVRENRGGMYFGTDSADAAGARHTFGYARDEVTRLADAAARLARVRRGGLAVVIKAGGIPSVSALWRAEAERARDAHGVALTLLDVDHAAYQLVAEPLAFDVVAAPNLFGDVLSDLGAVLLRSRGMSYSGNFGCGGAAVYQTGHGAAYDLAHTDQANPLGQIQALAMLLRESFGLVTASDAVLSAVDGVLAAHVRTVDVAGPGSTIVGTTEMGARVADAVRRTLAMARLSA